MNTGLEGTRRDHDTAAFNRSTLENGIPVWMQEPTIETDKDGILIACFPGVGAALDPSTAPGTAHFFEHIPFRGTGGMPSKQALIAPIYKKAGTVDANTSAFRTSYQVRVNCDHLEVAAAFLREMTMKPLCREEDVRLECGAILQEYRMKMASGEWVAMRHSWRALFGDYAFGNAILGTPESIERMAREILLEFHRKHYHAGNFAIICGGTFPQQRNTPALLDHYFGDIAKGTLSSYPLGDLPIRKEGKVRIVDPQCGRDSLRFIYALPRRLDSELRAFEALKFLARVLSSGFDAPLFRTLREERGLVYEDNLCYTLDLPKMGIFGFTCPTPRKNFKEAEHLFREALRTLDSDYVFERQQRRQLKRHSVFLHPVDACVEGVDDLVMHGTVRSYESVEDAQDAVTLEEVFTWRDYLLKTPPLAIELLVSK